MFNDVLFSVLSTIAVSILSEVPNVTLSGVIFALLVLSIELTPGATLSV